MSIIYSTTVITPANPGVADFPPEVFDWYLQKNLNLSDYIIFPSDSEFIINQDGIEYIKLSGCNIFNNETELHDWIETYRLTDSSLVKLANEWCNTHNIRSYEHFYTQHDNGTITPYTLTVPNVFPGFNWC